MGVVPTKVTLTGAAPTSILPLSQPAPSQRDLTVAYRAGIHVGLEDAIRRRIRDRARR